ncbi:site-specific integrase [Clostridium tagluense]|uniref:tyrosine-type recombinase/integrase n=1 Tax=Clostridium tagluense TaxID=360422 RepID=UPI001C6E6ECA|nr:site-specific integrase [Clostridium tagluense]MBW9158905.1 site-specific integrase [Clostridium tagluense]MCB2310686.1 site-specific integrase [Clostridium tagluense]MCB2315584.1 site-specific integrase [Clostridium tagluense]MCB2320438.1 site-specific integrase [Clostridium tagluense]MCB2325279.1 site-specific integrase [Clostridium tagluense]
MQYSTIIRKKDKGYQYIITYKDDENKWKTKSKQGYDLNKTGKELAQAEMDTAVAKLKKEVENPIDPSLKDITFEKFTEMYIGHVKIYRTANTIISYQTVMARFSGLNDIEMNKITLMDVQSIVDKMTIEGLNPNTVQDYIRKLNVFFNAAIDEYELITKSPTKKVKFNSPKVDKNKRALNISEEEVILKEIKNKIYHLIILIALKCGLRIGEIIGLTWSNIDLENAVIKVNQQWKKLATGEYGFGTLKTKKSYREVPIPATLICEFKSFKKVENINGRVFNSKNTTSVVNIMNYTLKKYNITLHELRHTYGTKLLANGMDPQTVAELLGHDVQETYRSYSHVNNDMRKRAAELINNFL